MRRPPQPVVVVVLAVLASGCGRLQYDVASDAAGIDAAGIDAAGIDAAGIDAAGIDAAGIDAAGIDAAGIDAAGIDGGPPTGVGPFGAPRRIDALASSSRDSDPTATADLLELYFTSDRLGGPGNLDIWMSRRASVTAPWGAPTPVIELSSLDNEQTPEVSPDGLTLWLSSTRTGGRPQYDVYVSTRASRAATWGVPTLIAALASDGDEISPTLSADRLRVMFHGYDSIDHDIHEATRASTAVAFGAPTQVMSLSTISFEGAPFLWDDARVVLFDSNRPGGAGSWDLYVAQRPSTAGAFGPNAPIAEVNTADKEAGPWLSPDGAYLLFNRGEEGIGDQDDIWEASR
ncbi:MAG: hypothetical protein M3Y87_10360 [Myxococcota bacterium]|nr:hypothetical protein [Myxococcota bacterium]